MDYEKMQEFGNLLISLFLTEQVSLEVFKLRMAELEEKGLVLTTIENYDLLFEFKNSYIC